MEAAQHSTLLSTNSAVVGFLWVTRLGASEKKLGNKVLVQYLEHLELPLGRINFNCFQHIEVRVCRAKVKPFLLGELLVEGDRERPLVIVDDLARELFCILGVLGVERLLKCTFDFSLQVVERIYAQVVELYGDRRRACSG